MAGVLRERWFYDETAGEVFFFQADVRGRGVEEKGMEARLLPAAHATRGQVNMTLFSRRRHGQSQRRPG